jgi:hypothetical protein
VTKTYSIQGTSQHNHTLTLTAAHFTMLKQGVTGFKIVSGAGGANNHTHEVFVGCA